MTMIRVYKSAAKHIARKRDYVWSIDTETTWGKLNEPVSLWRHPGVWLVIALVVVDIFLLTTWALK